MNDTVFSSSEEGTYPPLPWTLKGKAMIGVSLVETEAASQFVPPELKIISVWPGKTVGGIYLSSYSSGSTLEYSELAIICGLVKYSGKTGFWVSHIYVDEERSLRSGWGLWGWPKEPGLFSWVIGDRETRVSIRKGTGEALCTVSWRKPLWVLPAPASIPTFGSVAGDIRWFQGEGGMHAGVSGARVDISPGSPFEGLKLDKPFISVSSKDLMMTYHSIEILRQAMAPL